MGEARAGSSPADKGGPLMLGAVVPTPAMRLTSRDAAGAVPAVLHLVLTRSAAVRLAPVAACRRGPPGAREPAPAGSPGGPARSRRRPSADRCPRPPSAVPNRCDRADFALTSR